MRRVLKELALLICAVLVACGLILSLLNVVGTQSPYDTFTGRVNKVPLKISSPVYGQVLSLPYMEGGQVERGQPLAIIQVLDRNFRLPDDSQLFKLQGNTLRVVSPVSGVVGRVTIAPLSTVGASELIMQLYTVDRTDLQVLVPQGRELRSYKSFYASIGDSKSRYPIRIEGAMPAEVVSNISPTTNVYRASCESTADCWKLVNSQQVMVYAQKGGVKPPLSWLPHPSLPSFGPVEAPERSAT